VDSFSQEMVVLLPRLRRFARVLAGSAAEADDLVQAGCERALRRRDQFVPGTRLESWMFTIIRNLWVDTRRGGAARQREALPIDQAETVPGADGAAEAEIRITLGQAERAMLRLPAEQREALALVCIEEMTFQEASDMLGVPIGTVMSRVARARIALGREMAGAERVAGR
jgi:RNA polymerase sigma-70 factor (ECF subfamily)